MSSDLTVSETIELLGRLKRTLRECAASEADLAARFETSAAATDRRFKEQLESRERERLLESQRREKDFQEARAAMQARYQKRTAKISKAHKSAKRQAEERVNEEEGRRKYPLQRDVLETQRSQSDALREIDSSLAHFQRQLSAAGETLNARATEAYKLFRGYPSFRWLLERPRALAGTPADEYKSLDELRELERRAGSALARYRRLLLPKVFRTFPLVWWILLLGLGAGVMLPFGQELGLGRFSIEQLGFAALSVLIMVFVVYLFSKTRARPFAKTAADALTDARLLQELAGQQAESRHTQEKARIEAAASSRLRHLEAEWRGAEQEAIEARETLPRKIDEKSWRLSVKTDQLYHDQLDALDRTYRADNDRLKTGAEAWKQEHATAHAAKIGEMRTAFETAVRELKEQAASGAAAIRDVLAKARVAAERDFPDWAAPDWSAWLPPRGFSSAAKLGSVEVLVENGSETAPLVLRCPQEGSILFETSGRGESDAAAVLNGLILRLLSTTPAGKAAFTIIDPIKLGQNFAAITHLADYGEGLLNGRIWTETPQIDERLAELNAQMEKVIQNYLRNEYPTIAEYNSQAGSIAEKYQFLVIADFPVNFSEAAIRRLLRIAASGARCGVFTLIHWDHRHISPHEALLDEIRKSSICLSHNGGEWTLARPAMDGAKLTLDPVPDAHFITAFLRSVGSANRGATRVEVPFSVVAPSNAEVWSATSKDELRVAIGRSGAARTQDLGIGKGTRQHALIAGKTGSGKSTLFHTIITNLALWCSPDEVEFYLVDFKKGVEFKCYGTHRLPHARVVAIESDREFALSVLQRVDEELRVRGERFRKAGVLDLAGFRAAHPDQRMPRCLLIIDEFQEFFVEDDRIAQTANLLLDRIVRQGRAFGIHVLLGSQTLGGAYTLSRSTLGQMVVRIALQCNEADAYLIMDESNSAPRLLSRPGEGIYNDSAGAMEANSPFQAVWLPEDERDLWLKRVRKLADQRNLEHMAPIVFEGNAPADVRENAAFRTTLEAHGIDPAGVPRIWLGAPNAIKGATEAMFHRRSGSNLLVVGQNEEAISTMLSLSLLALAAQHPRLKAYHCGASASVPAPGAVYVANQDVLPAISDLANQMQERTMASDSDGAPMFLFIEGLQNFRKLRLEDEFAFSDYAGSPAAQLRSLITDGPSVGIHVVLSLDHYSNVTRFLGRKMLGEFTMRVLFQMSANDSASLCDDPKASTLSLHRALFYNEPQGHLETFRPYAPPGAGWLDDAMRHVSRLHTCHLPTSGTAEYQSAAQ